MTYEDFQTKEAKGVRENGLKQGEDNCGNPSIMRLARGDFFKRRPHQQGKSLILCPLLLLAGSQTNPGSQQWKPQLPASFKLM